MKAVQAWALLGATFVVVLAALPSRLRPTVRDVAGRAEPSGALPALCPPGTLPDESVCIPAPAPGASAPAASSTPGGRSPAHLPLRAGRSADFASYRFPFGGGAAPRATWARYEPSFATDGGAPLPGLALAVPPATPVVARALEGQQGGAVVVYAGRLVGTTLVTHHVVRQGDLRQEYLVALGNLNTGELPAPRVSLDDGVAVGKASAALVYLDVRLLRPGTDPWTIAVDALLSDGAGISVDPRNVYPTAR